jgi:hypothetical protein
LPAYNGVYGAGISRTGGIAQTIGYGVGYVHNFGYRLTGVLPKENVIMQRLIHRIAPIIPIEDRLPKYIADGIAEQLDAAPDDVEVTGYPQSFYGTVTPHSKALWVESTTIEYHTDQAGAMVQRGLYIQQLPPETCKEVGIAIGVTMKGFMYYDLVGLCAIGGVALITIAEDGSLVTNTNRIPIMLTNEFNGLFPFVFPPEAIAGCTVFALKAMNAIHLANTGGAVKLVEIKPPDHPLHQRRTPFTLHRIENYTI